MGLIPQSVIDRVRQVNESAMDKAARRLTRTATADGAGGVVATYEETGDEYPCRFRPASNAERLQITGGQPMTDPLFIASLPWDAVLDETDRLTIDEIAYDVIGWLGQHSYKVGAKVALKLAAPETTGSNTQ